MGKGKKLQTRHAGQKGGAGPRKMQSYAKLSTKVKKKNQEKQQQQRQNQPVVPFKPSDRILLIGEGELLYH